MEKADEYPLFLVNSPAMLDTSFKAEGVKKKGSTKLGIDDNTDGIPSILLRPLLYEY